MTRRRQFLSAAAVLLIAGLGMYFYLRRPKFDVGDGWKMELAATGVDHLEFSSDTTANSQFRAKAPLWMQVSLGTQLPVGVNTGSQGTLFFFFLVHSPSHVQPTTMNLPRPQLEIIDSNGVAYPVPSREGISPSGNSRLHGVLYSTDHYPRRDPQMRIRMMSSDGEQTYSEQTISNPGYKSSITAWTTEALPVTHTSGPLMLTLNGIEIDAAARQLKPRWAWKSDPPGWDQLTFDNEFSDATGNVGEWLSPFEPAWKIKTHVRRRRDSPFAPAEVGKLGTFPIPALASSMAFETEKTGTIGPVQIKPLWLLGVGKHQFDQGQLVSSVALDGSPGGAESVSWSGVGRCEIRAERPGLWIDGFVLPDLETHLDIRILDQNGHDLRPAGINDENRWFPFQPRPDSTSIEIECVVHRSQLFEFIVTPPDESRVPGALIHGHTDAR